MAYVEQFKARGTDLVTLDYFMKNRLGAEFPEAEKQQLVAQQVYDLARARGVKPGNMTTQDLDYIFEEMKQGVSRPLTGGVSNLTSGIRGGSPYDLASFRGGDLMPRTAMQMPMESMRSARYFNSGDAAADSAGAFYYHLADSLTLGLLGAAGGILKRVGLTNKNFWTETIGETQNFLGMDFGEGGIKGGDTSAGKWMARAGEVAGFILPTIVSGGTSLAASGPRLAAKGALTAAVEARNAGKLAQGAKLVEAAVSHRATARAIESAGAKVGKIASKMPATMVFEQSHKVLNKLFIGEAKRGLLSAKLVKTIGGESRVLGSILPKGGKAIVESAYKAAASAGGDAAYQAARGQAPGAIKAGAETVGKQLLGNEAVTQSAREVFQTRFMSEVISKMGLNTEKDLHKKFLGRLVESADDIFTTALKEARQDGLMSLQEKAFKKGYGSLGMHAAKAAEEAANHVTSMLALGLVTRVSHPLAEPQAFGISEESGFETAKDIAKYWVRGAGGSIFEGVTGDVVTGLMFATGGGMKLIPAFQRQRIKNPWEVMSMMLGHNSGEWKSTMDRVDRELFSLFKLAKKGESAAEKEGGVGGFFRKWMRRNRADFSDMNNVSLNTVAKNYLNFMERNADMLPGKIPFTQADLALAMKAQEGSAQQIHLDARERIVNALSTHFDHMMSKYTGAHKGALLKDLAQFGMVATATSFASNPNLWIAYGKGNSDIHPADLLSHTLFSAMMARQPYYMEGANPYLRARAEGQPVTSKMKAHMDMMRAKNAMRHLGMRDSALVLEPTEGQAADAAKSLGTITSDGMLNRAVEKAVADPTLYRYVGDEKNVENSQTDITAREMREFLAHTAARIRSGVVLPEDLLILNDRGEPMVFGGELTKNATAMDRIVQTIGQMKTELINAGHMDINEAFSYRNIARANASWYQEAVGKVTHMLSAGNDSEGGLISRMEDLVGLGSNGGLRYIEIKESDDPLEQTGGTKTVEAYNEIVDIIRDLGFHKVETDKQGAKLPRVIDISTKPTGEGDTVGIDVKDAEGNLTTQNVSRDVALLQQIEQFTIATSDLISKELGLDKSVELGRGNVGHMIRQAVLESNMNHSTSFAIHKGVLVDSEGNHVNADSIKKWLIENGWAMKTQTGEGKSGAITFEVDLDGYEGNAANSSTPKSRIVKNFLRYIEKIDGINVRYAKFNSDGKEGIKVSHEALDRLFDETVQIPDARSNVIIEKRKGGLYGLMKDVGLVFSNDKWTDAMVRDTFRERNLGLDERHFRIMEAMDAAGLSTRNEAGDTEYMIPLVTKSPEGEDFSSGTEQIDGDIPNDYTAIGEAIASHDLMAALGEANHKYLLQMIGELKDAGVIAGLSAPRESLIGSGPVPGTYRVYGNPEHPELVQLAGELTYLENRSPEQALVDLDNAMDYIAKEINHIPKRKGGNAKRQNLRKLLAILQRIRNGGGYWFQAADKFMIEKGLIKLGKGFKEKYYIPSDEEVVETIKDLEVFYAQEQNRRKVADQSILRMEAEGVAEQARSRLLDSDKADRESMSNFMVSVGYASNGRLARNAHIAFERALDQASTVPATELANSLREELHGLLRGTFIRDAYTEAVNKLSEYSDNYLLSLAQESKNFFVDMYILDEGTSFSQETKPTNAPGEHPVVGKTQLQEPSALGTAQTSAYRVTKKVLNVASRDHAMRQFADFAFVDRQASRLEGDRLESKRREVFADGMQGRTKNKDRLVSTAEQSHSVLLREMRQGGDYIAVEVPADRLTARRFVDAANRMMSEYRSEPGGEFDGIAPGETELRNVLNEMDFAVRELESILGNEDATVEDFKNFSLRGHSSLEANHPMQRNTAQRRLMWQRIFELARIHNYAGSDMLKSAFEDAMGPDSKAISNIVARASLASNGSAIPYDKDIFNASIESYMASNHSVKDDNSKLTYADLSNTLGLNIGEDGKFDSMRVVVYDGSSTADEIQRSMPDMDSGFILNRNLIEMMWHTQGYDVLSNTDVSNSVAKVRLFDMTQGLLSTKDVASTDSVFKDWMSENNIAAVISIDALKQLSGSWKELAGDATVRFPGEDGAVSHDLPRMIMDGRGHEFQATPMNVPISSMLWTHPVDANPDHASRSPQITNFKEARMVADIVAMMDAKQEGLVSDFKSLLGGLGVDRQMAMHFMFSNSGRIMTDAEMASTIKQSSNAYMEQGGPYASPLHYGGRDHYLSVLKTKLINDNLFKMRTKNGSQGVYTVDLRRVIDSGEMMMPFGAALQTTSASNAYVGYKLATPELASAANRETFGWGDRPEHHNEPGAGNGVMRHEPSNIGHFKLWSGGSNAGIAPGLIAMRHSDRDVTVRSRTIDKHGNAIWGSGDTMGANATKKLVKDERFSDEEATAIAGVINDAWQAGMKEQNDKRAIAAIGKALVNLQDRGVNRREIVAVSKDLMASRENALVGMRDGSDLVDWMWKGTGNQDIENYRVHNALSYMFGGYDYDQRMDGMTSGLGAQTFGLSAITQRHPSTMINDNTPTMMLGFLGPRDGNQIKANWHDAELIMKADQDEDHIHFWHDFGKNELGEALRNRGLAGGFTEPDVAPMPARNFFSRTNDRQQKTYVDDWADRQDWGKQGIGMISKALTVASDALHKEIAFEFDRGGQTTVVAPIQSVNGNGQHISKDGDGANVMDRTQSLMQGAFGELTELHNAFLDTKAGSSINPKAIDLQGEVLSKFFAVYTRGKDGKLTRAGDLTSDRMAMDALKRALSPLYRISSLGKDALTPDGRKSQTMADTIQLASRYSSVYGRGLDHQRTLADWITVGLGAESGASKKNAKYFEENYDPRGSDAIRSVRVLTDSDVLSKRTVYDSASETILKAEGQIMSDSAIPFLTADEAVAFHQGNKAVRVFAPDMKTAGAARFVAELNNSAKALISLDKRIRDGESLLTHEAASARKLLTEGRDFWKKTVNEAAYSKSARSKRMQPQTALERFDALHAARDGMGIHLARAFMAHNDKRPHEAEMRLKESLGIIQETDRNMAKFLSGAIGGDPRVAMDQDKMNAILEARVANYMGRWGSDGNEVVAALDLFTPRPFGYFIENGMEITRYRSFPQAIFNAVLKSIPNTGTVTGHTGEWGELQTRNLMEVMARSAATADAVLSGDPQAMYSLNALVEVIEGEGHSVTAALQFNRLGSDYRNEKAQRNLQLASLNRGFSDLLAGIEGSGFGVPGGERYGFGNSRTAEQFLRAAIADDEPVMKARILARTRRSKGSIPDDLLDPVLDDNVAKISIYKENKDNILGSLEAVVKSGETRNEYEAEGKKRGKKERIPDAVRDARVRRRESLFLQQMLKSLDANNELRGEVLSSDLLDGESLIAKQRRFKFERCE